MTTVTVSDTRPPKPKRAPQQFWTVPRLWPGSTIYMLGGGPSLKGLDISCLQGQRVIAVNNAYRLAPWADVMFFGDCRWYEWHRNELGDFAGLKVTSCEAHANKPNLRVLRRRNSPEGINTNPQFLSWNKSSGACALNLAYHLGAGKIVLLGYDMRRVDDKCNWHDDHPIAKNPHHNPWERFLRPFPAIARDFERLHVEVVNATPGSALEVFPIVEPETVLPPNTLIKGDRDAY